MIVMFSLFLVRVDWLTKPYSISSCKCEASFFISVTFFPMIDEPLILKNQACIKHLLYFILLVSRLKLISPLNLKSFPFFFLQNNAE